VLRIAGRTAGSESSVFLEISDASTPTRSRSDRVASGVATSSPLPVRLRVRGLKDLVTERLANRVILYAARLLGVAAGTHLSEFRGRDGGYQDLKARLDRAEILASVAWRAVDLLHARLARVPDRRRPHYSPAARFEILEIRNLLGWNQSRAASQFLVSDNTISNWERDQSPQSKTVGSLAKPIPPVTRLSDATRHLVQMMGRFGFGGSELIASHLALAGFRIAEKTVRNIKRERIIAPAMVPQADPPRPPNPVVANFVHHVWMMDVTEFRTLFGANGAQPPLGGRSTSRACSTRSRAFLSRP